MGSDKELCAYISRIRKCKKTCCRCIWMSISCRRGESSQESEVMYPELVECARFAFFENVTAVDFNQCGIYLWNVAGRDWCRGQRLNLGRFREINNNF